MPPKRQTALQLALLAIAMAALVALSAAGPTACTPAAPAGQAAADATAEPTATATTAAASAPTPEPTATPEATSTPTPAPTATIAPTNSKMEPMLNALVTQSQSAGAQGAAGQTARMVGVVIDLAEATDSVFLANSDAIDRLVTSNGGTYMGNEAYLPPVSLLPPGGEWISYNRHPGEYSVPVFLLPQLAAHPAVVSVTAAWPVDFPYPRLSRALNNAVAVWQAGASPQQAAAAYSPLVYDDKILVFVQVVDVAALDRVDAFFGKNKVYVGPDSAEIGLELVSRAALVPVPLLASLSRVSGITKVEDIGEAPIPPGKSISPEIQEFINLVLYPVLPPDQRSQLSPLPTEVWELEGITPTPKTSTPAPSSGRVGGATPK